MTIHREGYASIIISAIILLVIDLLIFRFFGDTLLWLCISLIILSFLFWLGIVSFFRLPSRQLTIHENQIISPADGKVVVIEETVDEEYFKTKRLQISVFMSPANVHVNRNPLSGEVVYNQSHTCT